MANKKSDSIDESAFQALEAALSIDFDNEAPATKPVRPAARASESPVSEPVQNPASAKKPQERRAVRSSELAPEPAPKAPALAPANDTSRRTPAADGLVGRSLAIKGLQAALGRKVPS